MPVYLMEFGNFWYAVNQQNTNGLIIKIRNVKNQSTSPGLPYNKPRSLSCVPNDRGPGSGEILTVRHRTRFSHPPEPRIGKNPNFSSTFCDRQFFLPHPFFSEMTNQKAHFNPRFLNANQQRQFSVNLRRKLASQDQFSVNSEPHSLYSVRAKFLRSFSAEQQFDILC